MNRNTVYMDMLREQCARWPLLTAQDLTKALYQAFFGCGHFTAANDFLAKYGRRIDWSALEAKL